MNPIFKEALPIAGIAGLCATVILISICRLNSMAGAGKTRIGYYIKYALKALVALCAVFAVINILPLIWLAVIVLAEQLFGLALTYRDYQNHRQPINTLINPHALDQLNEADLRKAKEEKSNDV
jgi:uncharacterized membrane protein (Fun14 family)